MTKSLPLDLPHLLAHSEDQYFERKSLFEGPPSDRKPRARRKVRDQVAEYVAAFANADGGTLVLGVEDDGTITGHAYNAEDIGNLLAVPERRLKPPLCRGEVVTVGEHEVMVFQVDPEPQAVMVIGDGFPRRVDDKVFQESEQIINRKGTFTNRDYQALNAVDRDTAYREIKDLIRRHLLESVEPGGRIYNVVGADSPALPDIVERAPSHKRRLARIMEEKGRIRNQDYQDAMGVERSQAKEALRDLVALDVIVLQGERRGASYVRGHAWEDWILRA